MTTRKARANAALIRAKHGPSFSDPLQTGGTPLTVEEAHRQYVLWAETWLVPDLEALLARDLKERGG